MTARAEIGHPELNVIKVTKKELKELVIRCTYRPLGYHGIGAFYVRGHRHIMKGLQRLCRIEDRRDARNSQAR